MATKPAHGLKAEALESLSAKLRRSKDHLDQFNAECEAAFGPERDRIVVGNDPEARDAFERAWSGRLVPVRLAIISGEAIQQIRSSLDHLVCYLIRREGNAPNRSSQFPILSGAPSKKNDRFNAQMTGIARAEVRAIIESHQPYMQPPGARAGHILAILKALSDQDKHRSLLLHVVFRQGRTKMVVKTRSGGGRVTLTSRSPEEGLEPPPSAFLDGKPIDIESMENSYVAQVGFENWGGTGRSIDAPYAIYRFGEAVGGIIKQLLPYLD